MHFCGDLELKLTFLLSTGSEFLVISSYTTNVTPFQHLLTNRAATVLPSTNVQYTVGHAIVYARVPRVLLYSAGKEL